ncbi:hypothetical protein L211DRAFT_679656 [Terfezia boudieri ATCC MYA-4762]|uniref:Uncharacterized protein n=1 Tax=Terfezia boudieri ATCC MYA-4762 TaxID=1051890 RepID=A0A3N4LZB3_9PEZI|nr:hypothetical protein L211DRAFT_679656 [Terfezia boudieri ATCC MYA-4762]
MFPNLLLLFGILLLGADCSPHYPIPDQIGTGCVREARCGFTPTQCSHGEGMARYARIPRSSIKGQNRNNTPPAHAMPSACTSGLETEPDMAFAMARSSRDARTKTGKRSYV